MIKSFTSDSKLPLSPLFELRWTTLGYHHNWETRKYAKETADKGEMPEILEKIATEISRVIKLESELVAEASICNYYPANVGTIGIHRDNSGMVFKL